MTSQPILVIHARADVPNDWLQGELANAREAFGASMEVVPLQGYGGDATAFADRDVVLWPWLGGIAAQRDLRPFAAVVARTAKRVRMICPPAELDGKSPAFMVGKDAPADPVAWARQHCVEIEASTFDDGWLDDIGPVAAPIEETHDRVLEPEPERRITVSDFIADEARPRFVFHAALDLVKEPTPTDWLLHGWFERNTLACYFGDPGSCKTWIALSQAVHIAIGAPWYGQRVQQGAVFILCGEGQRGFRRRLEGIRKYHEMSFEHVPLYVSEGPANLTDPDSVTDVLVSVQNLVEQCGAAPVLIVIDTLSRNFGPADENSTPDMTAFIGACDRIRQTYGSTVLVVHHSGHTDKTRGRGNSALRAALDSEYKFARDDAGVIASTCTKAKDFEMPEPRNYELANVTLDWPPGEDGLPVMSASVIESTAQPEAPRGTQEQPQARRQPVGDNQIQAMAKLTELIFTRRRVLVTEGRDPTGARVNLNEWRDACNLDRRRFYEVHKALERSQLVNSDGFWVQLNES